MCVFFFFFGVRKKYNWQKYKRSLNREVGLQVNQYVSDFSLSRMTEEVKRASI